MKISFTELVSWNFSAWSTHRNKFLFFYEVKNSGYMHLNLQKCEDTTQFALPFLLLYTGK